MTKKDIAFALFKSGKRMPHDEVQALKLTQETLNRYWTEWVLSGAPWSPDVDTKIE